MKFVWPHVIESPRPYRGLARRMSLRREWSPPLCDRPMPFGWRFLREWDRHSVLLMPLWLYWFVRLWEARYERTFGVLHRVGFYRTRDEWGYWREGYVTWRAWLTFDDLRRWGRLPSFDEDPVPITFAERVARWLERLVNDWNERDPNGDMRRAGVL